MTDERMKAMLSAVTGETDDDMLLTFLDIAAESITARCFPFRREGEETAVPEKYHMLQLEIASYLLNKRGAEGQISHNENGINRSYESAGVPESMLRRVVPYAGTFNLSGGESG